MANVEVTSNRIIVTSLTYEAMKTAGEKIGGIIEGHAKELCPVDTGLLRNSIAHGIGGQTITTAFTNNGVNKNGEKRDKIVHVLGLTLPKDSENQVTVYVGTNVEYAPYVELGHHQQPGRFVPAIGKRLKASFVAARPFLRPAAENNMGEIAQVLGAELKNIG